jgi:hypothetical protein
MTTTTPVLSNQIGQESNSRFTRLAAAVRGLRTRAANTDLERALLIVGGVLMPLGVLLILLGWEGVSHTPLPFEQNSYLISGGILGLALVFAGGFIYFAYWQTVRIRESREQAKEQPAAVNAGQFVATPSGSIFHRADCSVVAGRTDLSTVNPQRTKLEPCRICTPLD